MLIEAVAFHRATVCRQEAWLKGTELRTEALLYPAKKEDKGFHASCRFLFLRTGEEITWQKIPSLEKRNFKLSLDGKL